MFVCLCNTRVPNPSAWRDTDKSRNNRMLVALQICFKYRRNVRMTHCILGLNVLSFSHLQFVTSRRMAFGMLAVCKWQLYVAVYVYAHAICYFPYWKFLAILITDAVVSAKIVKLTQVLHSVQLTVRITIQRPVSEGYRSTVFVVCSLRVVSPVKVCTKISNYSRDDAQKSAVHFEEQIRVFFCRILPSPYSRALGFSIS
jgi:hypothetical protein